MYVLNLGLLMNFNFLLTATFTKAYVAVTTMKISSAGTRCVSSLTTSKIEFAGGTVTSSYPVMYVALGSKS